MSANTYSWEIFWGKTKPANASRTWKYVLDHRYFLKKSIHWCLRNGDKIKIWHDNWIDKSPLIDKIPLEHRSTIKDDDKTSQFINENKSWKIGELKELLPTLIVEKVINISILLLISRIKWYVNLLLTETFQSNYMGKVPLIPVPNY